MQHDPGRRENGGLRVIRNGVLAPTPVWTSPTPAGQGSDSLHFVAVHPQFAQNHLVYVSYPKQGEGHHAGGRSRASRG